MCTSCLQRECSLFGLISQTLRMSRATRERTDDPIRIRIIFANMHLIAKTATILQLQQRVDILTCRFVGFKGMCCCANRTARPACFTMLLAAQMCWPSVHTFLELSHHTIHKNTLPPDMDAIRDRLSLVMCHCQ
jgi:hypothetical protein